MECCPALSDDVVNVAIPLVSLPLPNWLGPSKNVTVPIAVLGNTVAWNVRLWPDVDGLVPELRLSVVVLGVSGAATLMVRLAPSAVCAGALLSFTCTVKVELPIVLGVPPMKPVEALSERAGSPAAANPWRSSTCRAQCLPTPNRKLKEGH